MLSVIIQQDWFKLKQSFCKKGLKEERNYWYSMEKDIKTVNRLSKSFLKTRNFLFITRKKTIIIVLVLLLVGYFGWQKIFSQNKQPQYQTAQVQKGTIISTVSESGNVASTSQAGVGSPTTGIVTDVYVKDGDTVTQGKNLFKVKSIATAQEIAAAYAGYLSANSTLQADNATLYGLQSTMYTNWQKYMDTATNSTYQNSDSSPNTSNRVLTPFTIAQDNWLLAEAQYKDQQNVIAKDQASLNNASLAYQATQDSVVTAPIGGTVINIGVQTGDQVTASGGNLSSNISTSSTSSTSNAILYIGDYSSPYVKVQASEVDITNIQAGQKATINLSAFPGKTFVGTIKQVDTAGTISSGVVTYNAYISFVVPPSTIKPGMSASVIIQTALKDNVLTVPSSAIQTSNGQSTVRVLKNGKVTPVDVTTGIASDSDTEIVSGLSEGDTVVTGTVTTGANTGNGTASPFGRSVGGFGGGIGRGGRGGGG